MSRVGEKGRVAAADLESASAEEQLIADIERYAQ
jgi:hypothetical protein